MTKRSQIEARLRAGTQHYGVQARLLKRADALASAARRRMLQWIREGVSLEEILQRVSSVSVSGELKKLEDELRVSMELIYKAEVGDQSKTRPVGKSEIKSQMSFDAIFAKVDLFTPAIRSDVRKTLRSEVEKAIDSRIGVDGLKRNLQELKVEGALTLANTSISGFNNTLTIEQAKVAQIESFMWDGPPPMENSHKLCKKNVGKIFTLAQLRVMNNGAALPVEQYLGGYNCRHYLTAVLD